MTRRALLLLVAVLIGMTVGGGVQPGAAQVVPPGSVAPIDGQQEPGTLPNRLVGRTGVDETRLGTVVPGDLTFVDEAGQPVQLASLLGQDKPVMVAFVYHSCPMLCSLVLDGVAEAVETSSLTLGTDYEVLAVSIDPRDTPARADSAKARYVRQIGTPEAEAGLHFWTVTPETEDQVQTLADDVGFGYAFDPPTGEFAHSAALFFLSPAGKVSRILYGIQYPERDVRLALTEAGEGSVGSPLDRFLLTCYQFDENARSYSLVALTLLKFGGGLLLLLLGGLLVVLWRREARRQHDADPWADADLSGAAGLPPAP